MYYLQIFCVICAFAQIYANKPNIVFIVADDLGWNDVGWRNSKMITPNLDKLAKAGIILDQNYVQPVCTPSRSSFLTGYYPYRIGMQGSPLGSSTPIGLPLNLTIFPQYLKNAGYATHMVGKWHLGFCKWDYTPTFRGFDTFYGFYNGGCDYYTHKAGGKTTALDFRDGKEVVKDQDGVYLPESHAKRAVKIIESHKDETSPMFLYLAFNSPHTPLQVSEKYEKMYSNIKNNNRRVYSGMVTAMDEMIGLVVNALEDTGMMSNTLLVFTSDNGGGINKAGGNNYPLRGAKGSLWEGGTRVPGFVYGPNFLHKSGHVETGLMHTSDWFATFLEVAGVEISGSGLSSNSISQWKTFSKGSQSKRTELVYDITDDVSAIRVGDYKLIEGTPGRNDWYPEPEDESNTSETTYYLFNLADDPTESKDLSNEEPEILETMKTKLATLRQKGVPKLSARATPRKSNPTRFGGYWSPGWC